MNEFSWRREAILVLWALLIAFFIWLIAVQADREISWVPVPVRVENVPENMTIRVVPQRPDQPPTVQVNVQFPRELLGRINESNMSAVIDGATVFSTDPEQWQPPTEPRRKTYPLTARSNIRKNALPDEVDLIEIDPSEVELEGRLRTAQARVEVPTRGELPARLQLSGELSAEPAEVYVTGSREALEAFAETTGTLRTVPVDLSQVSESRILPRELRLPEGLRLVDADQQPIRVNVGVRERPVTRTIEAVPIDLLHVSEDLRIEVTPTSASVTVEGASSLLERLGPGDFTFTTAARLEGQAGASQAVGLEPGFSARVAQEVSEGVEILRVTPPRITVEFVPREAENTEDAATTGAQGAQEAAQ